MDDLRSGASYKVMVDADDYTVMSEYEASGGDSSAYQSEAALEEKYEEWAALSEETEAR